MRGIGCEPALEGKPLLEPVERAIDRDHQRERLGRHIGLRQPDRDRSRPDIGRLG